MGVIHHPHSPEYTSLSDIILLIIYLVVGYACMTLTRRLFPEASQGRVDECMLFIWPAGIIVIAIVLILNRLDDMNGKD